MSRQHNMEEERIRLLLVWPLNPMHPTTWRGHVASLKKKIAKIRRERGESQNVGNPTESLLEDQNRVEES